MAKTMRKILSPAVIAAVDGILKQRHEMDERLLAEVRRNETLLIPDGGADVTNPEVQKGRVLTRGQLVHRIRKLNPNLWYEQSRRFPKQGGLYIEDPETPYRKRMVAAFSHDRVNEFSRPLTVPDVIPAPGWVPVWQKVKRIDNKEPGWRTVLLNLIKEGLISTSGAEKEFQISQGRSSQKWQQAIN